MNLMSNSVNEYPEIHFLRQCKIILKMKQKKMRSIQTSEENCSMAK